MKLSEPTKARCEPDDEPDAAWKFSYMFGIKENVASTAVLETHAAIKDLDAEPPAPLQDVQAGNEACPIQDAEDESNSLSDNKDVQAGNAACPVQGAEYESNPLSDNNEENEVRSAGDSPIEESGDMQMQVDELRKEYEGELDDDLFMPMSSDPSAMKPILWLKKKYPNEWKRYACPIR